MKIIKKAWLVTENHDFYGNSEVVWGNTAGQAKKAYVLANQWSYKDLKAKRFKMDDVIEFEGTEQYRWAVAEKIAKTF